MPHAKQPERASDGAVSWSGGGSRLRPGIGLTVRRAAALGVAVGLGLALQACSDGIRYPSIADIAPITVPVLTPNEQAKAVSELETIREQHGAEAVKAINAPKS